MNNKKNKLTIFASYDKDNIIDDYVIYYIKELNKFSDIIYVSDCNIHNDELSKIKDYCLYIINGRHGEYDFGSYKRGFIYAKDVNILKDYDILILCNDSVYGPFFDLQSTLESFYNADKDVFGIFKYLKDNIYPEHLQSYFICMKKKVFLSDIYINFINSIKKEENRSDIINKYEIGMSLLFNENNYSNMFFIDSSLIENRKNNNLPFFYTFDTINNKFPFLKISLFSNSLYSHFTIYELINIINKIKDVYPIDIIVNHLNRVIDKDNIKYLFPKYRERKILDLFFINIYSCYSESGKYQIIFKFFMKIKITLDIKKSKSYIDYGYKNYNFLYNYLKR